MHLSSLRRMEWFARHWLDKTDAHSVLDVGSYDVNGCYRPFFSPPRYRYTGLDMAPGPNVDVVPFNPYVWDTLGDASFDAIISGQAFEHIEFFWLTMAEMVRVLRPGGLLCLVAPWGFERHRYPVDCYRFEADGMVALARWTNLEVLHASTNLAPKNAGEEWYSDDSADSLLIARKAHNWSGCIDPRNYTLIVPDLEALAGDFVPKTQEFFSTTSLADKTPEPAPSAPIAAPPLPLQVARSIMARLEQYYARAK